jgi:hypothetical protein
LLQKTKLYADLDTVRESWRDEQHRANCFKDEKEKLEATIVVLGNSFEAIKEDAHKGRLALNDANHKNLLIDTVIQETCGPAMRKRLTTNLVKKIREEKRPKEKDDFKPF